MPYPIELTPQAAKRFKEVIDREPDKDKILGIYLGCKGGGCSGLTNVIDYQKEIPPEDWFEYDQWGVKIFSDPYSGSIMNGTIVDFEDSLQKQGFSFTRPGDEDYRTCGCGSSFNR